MSSHQWTHHFTYFLEVYKLLHISSSLIHCVCNGVAVSVMACHVRKWGSFLSTDMSFSRWSNQPEKTPGNDWKWSTGNDRWKMVNQKWSMEMTDWKWWSGHKMGARMRDLWCHFCIFELAFLLYSEDVYKNLKTWSQVVTQTRKRSFFL